MQLSDWLAENQVTHVAMESTGVYWKPIYNLLEDSFTVLLVNAHHVKIVPGRKTDVKDAQWIADLLGHGLLRASFVPQRPQRELRELVRYRRRLIQERAQVVSRIQRLLEGANIKLSSVASDIQGASGLEILRALAQGEEDPKALAQLAKGQLRKKLADLELALQGLMGPICGSCSSLNCVTWNFSRKRLADWTKDKYLSAQYHRLAARRRKKRASMAVAHSLLTAIYYMLRDGSDYRELGGSYFDQRSRYSTVQRSVQRIERLGYKVTLEAA